MAIEQTLSILKPDAVRRDLSGVIISKFEENGLKVVASRMQFLGKHEAEGFYAVHKDRPFFGELVNYMCSGPVLLMVLEGEDAIKKNRTIMGATNPKDAAEGTLRKLFAISLTENTVHGSDAPATAAFEISWFFKGSEICSRS